MDTLLGAAVLRMLASRITDRGAAGLRILRGIPSTPAAGLTANANATPSDSQPRRSMSEGPNETQTHTTVRFSALQSDHVV